MNTRFQRILSRAGVNADLRELIGPQNYDDFLTYAPLDDIFWTAKQLKLIPCTCSKNNGRCILWRAQDARDDMNRVALLDLLPSTQAELEKKFPVPSSGRIYLRKTA